MYPALEPYAEGHLDVGDGHNLHYELCGNPQGIPAVFLHGGPGAGVHPDLRRLFDPERYKVVLFDQRGCGKSTPWASVENNTIEKLVDDVDKVRRELGIARWMVTGASWGSTLSLLYAIKYPQAVAHTVLSGIFYGDREGAAWLAEEGGASAMMPPEWFDSYRDFIPEDKRRNGLIAAYDAVMSGGTEAEKIEAARRFVVWDRSIIKYDVPMDLIQEVYDDPKKFVPMTRAFFHFASHYYTDANKQDILDGVKALAHIPCAIIHGRFDLICPVRNAYDLHAAWPGSTLDVLPQTGHTLREPLAARKFIEITDRIAGG